MFDELRVKLDSDINESKSGRKWNCCLEWKVRSIHAFSDTPRRDDISTQRLNLGQLFTDIQTTTRHLPHKYRQFPAYKKRKNGMKVALHPARNCGHQ
jgi:hypothetical protein